MLPFISFGDSAVDHESRTADILTSLDGIRQQLRSATSSDGGIRRNDVLALLRPHLLGLDFTVESNESGAVRMPTGKDADDVDFAAFHTGSAIALTVHGGRAWNNNEATVAVLKMAAARRVRTGVIVLPEFYKGTASAAKAIDFLQRLAAWDGVRLDLDGVAALVY
jgi:hypothetical protein